MRMHLLAIPMAVLGIVLSMAPMAMADTHTDTQLTITITCDIHHDDLDDIMAVVDAESGSIHLGSYAQYCVATTGYVQTNPASDVVVTIPDGALFPDCQVTNDCFDPYTITIPEGTGVTWVNHDTVPHTVTGMEQHPDGTFDGFILSGEEFTFTFETPGSYWYGCSVHPWARGVVTVEPSDGMAGMPGIPAMHPNAEVAVAQVGQLLELYMEGGEDAFDAITMLDPFREVAGLIVSLDDYVIVAHNANPLFVGFPIGHFLDTASMPADIVLQMIQDTDSGVWLSYPVPNILGDTASYERGWFRVYDGYAFMSSYSVTIDESVQGMVSEIMRLYDMAPDTTFDMVNSFMVQTPEYPFVVDADTNVVVADGYHPGRVGGVSVELTGTTLEAIRGLEDGYGVWVEYVFNNPATGTDDVKRSWLVTHDGYVFGAGYYP